MLSKISILKIISPGEENMKNSVKKIALLLMLMTALAFTACDESGGGDLTVAVTGITLDKNSADIHFGSTEQLTAAITPVDAANQKLRWTSSDETVATVSETGLVTAKEYGIAAIIVSTKDSGFTATCNVTVSYALRDIGPGGGYIFSKEKSEFGGWIYKEAASYDFSSSIAWDSSSTGGSFALEICASYGCYLPSKDELNGMYVNLKQSGLGGFADEDYWSSTNTGNNAWAQNFNTGEQITIARNTELRVRGVRSF